MSKVPSVPRSWQRSLLRITATRQFSGRKGPLIAAIALALAVVLAVAVSSAVAVGGAPVASDDPGVISAVSKVLSADGGASDLLGVSVSVSGDTAVVGAPKHTVNGVRTGAAYIFTRTAYGWEQQAELVADDGAAGDEFGWAVSISGDTVLVGAQNAVNGGAAYVFVRSGTSWVQQAKLTAPDGAAGDRFGSSVSLSGDSAAVGAYYNDEKNLNAGAAYVFTRVGAMWTLQTKLMASDGYATDLFGMAVSLSGDSLAVGALEDDDKGTGSGSAYVFVRSGSTWSQQAKLLPADGSAEDSFGAGVSISDGIIAVGAPQDDDKDSDSGSAYVFARAGTTWTQQAKLTASDGAADDLFGLGISISGDNLFVGACRDDDRGTDAGSAYLYVRSGGTWAQRTKLTDPAGGAGGLFGYSVIASPSGAFIGSPGDRDRGTESGSAFCTELGYQGREDEQLNIAALGVLGNDTDQESDALTASLVSNASHGRVALAENGSFTYTPAPNWRGTDSFTYRAYDGTSHSAPATVTIVVADIPDMPVALSDRVETAEDHPAVINPLANDVDADGDALSFSLVNKPAHGAVVFDASGEVTYTPSASWNGTDAFSYRLFDGIQYSAPATVTVTVTAVNDVPVAVDDPSLMAAARAVFAEDGAATDYLGIAVSVSGDTAVVGAAGRDDDGADAGAAYVFVRDGATWAPQAALTSGESKAGANFFGRCVAISGDTIVVGANDDHTGSHVGAAYVFTRTGNVWSRQAKLTASDGEAYDNFARAVSISGDSIAVGVPYDRNFSGSVYVFSRAGDAWTEQAKLVADDAKGGDMFGTAVSIDGDSLAVGSPMSAPLYGAESGALYVFTRTGGVWTKQARVVADDEANRMLFASSVALLGDRVLVGAPGRTSLHGSAYVFERAGTTWNQQAKLAPTNGAAGDVFGYSVALGSDTAIVGSPDDDSHGIDSGSVWAFTRSGSAWSRDAKFMPSDGGPNDWLGYSVAVSGDFMVAGAPGQDDLSTDSGAMYASAPAFLARAGGQLRIRAEDILGNDSDVEGTTLTAHTVAAPTHGSMVRSADGAFVYTPVPGWTGGDSFTYRASDGSAYSSTATVTVMTAPADRVVTRVAGANRFEVAANLARKGWDPSGDRSWTGVTDVIVANGENGKEADPLSAAGLAGAYDCPVLLTGAASVPAATKAVIADIAKKNPGLRVHIIGGTGSVPDARWNDIRRIAGVSTAKDRIQGANRYDVSAAVAKRVVSVAGTDTVQGVILIAADNTAAFYDALAASPIAYANTMPMLSVRKDSVPAAVAAMLKSSSLAEKPRYAASSATYIGSASLSGATRLTDSSNRYAAATAIAVFAVDRGWVRYAHTGVSAKLPDALTGGSYLGKRGGVMLFTDSSRTLQASTAAQLGAHRGGIRNGWIFGGTGSVPAAQETSFGNLLK